MNLRPFFCFFGGKWRAAKRYPVPSHQVLIEPFAGGAGYATRYPDREVHLYDLDEAIVGVWSYLVSVSPEELRALPLRFDSVDDLPIPQEARWLLGFWINKAGTTPKKSPSAWVRAGTSTGCGPASFWGPEIRERLAMQVPYIRHWKVHHASYETAPDVAATWFIDPPYNSASGNLYRHHDIDFPSLASWSLKRQGQLIVCEREGAAWLPFESIGRVKATAGSRGKNYSNEVAFVRDE